MARHRQYITVAAARMVGLPLTKETEMTHVARVRSMVALTLMVMVGLASTGTASSESARVAQLKRIGHPAWKPVDFHLFSAPFGTAGDGYAEFVSTALSLLPAPNHVFHPA